MHVQDDGALDTQDTVEYDVVLLPTFTQVEDWRKRHARGRAGGLFAQTVTTWNAWIADLWELHGDGRAIVDSLQRQVVMQAAFEQMADEDGVLGAGAGRITVSPGVVKLAARCAREAAGLSAFEQALDEARSLQCPAGLSARETTFLQGVACYRELLFSASLAEVGQASAHLARHADEVFPASVRVLLVCMQPPDWRMAHFFESCANVQLEVELAPGAEGVERMPQGTRLRFGFPAGRYAQAALVADLVRERLDCARESGALASEDRAAVVVACKDPLALYKDLERELAGANAALAVQATESFASTDFGQRFLQLCRALGDDFDACDVADAAFPPFSGFSESDARLIDARLRADRIADRDAVLSTLRTASETFSQLEEAAGDPEADILLGVFSQIAFSTPGRSQAWRSEQLAAVNALRSCTSAAREVGASMKGCLNVLEDVVVTLSYEAVLDNQAQGMSCVKGTGGLTHGVAETRPAVNEQPPVRQTPRPFDTRVIVTTQDVAAQMGPGSCDMLVLCDLTSDDYPVADKDDAARTLFSKLGLQPADTALARARRTLRALQDLAVDELVALRPLNDRDGNPTYACAVVQELIDSYRADATDDAELDEVFGLPAQLMEGMVQRGEELLFANATARVAGTAQEIAQRDGAGGFGILDAAHVPQVALARGVPQGVAPVGFAPSPSQVEAYLSCPYKWFAQSRLKTEALDEGFGALERGSFAHAVLQEFYRRFQAQGHAKVNAGNLDEARALMRAVADEQERAQRQMDPGSGRYVARDLLEQRTVAAAKGQLVKYLDFEAAFLPTFHPAHLEYAIGPEDGVRYAGHAFVGTVDRIDVDDRGRAVIVDYKGSVNASHAIAGKTSADAGKVQARMYAQVVQRALGLKVVGALYVSYGKAHRCAGAFDAYAIDPAHLPFCDPEHSRCAPESSFEALADDDFGLMAFQDMLDETESLVARAIASMEEGQVQPAPATPDSCAFCPCDTCPKRGA